MSPHLYPLRCYLPPDPMSTMGDKSGLPEWNNTATVGWPMAGLSPQARESFSDCPPSVLGGSLENQNSNDPTLSLDGHVIPSTVWMNLTVGGGPSTATSLAPLPQKKASEAPKVLPFVTDPPAENPGPSTGLFDLPEEATGFYFPQSSSSTPVERTPRASSAGASPYQDTLPGAEVANAVSKRVSGKRKLRNTSL